jgi:tetratricopeptide (TPR) repeat protein
MALVEAKRYPEALPLLTRSAGEARPSVDALYYLGRCQIALGRAADGVASLRAALDRSTGIEAVESRTGKIHYQLGVALRSIGSVEESASHFAAAEKMSVTRVDAERERLALYLADAPEGEAALPAVPLPLATPIEAMTPDERRRLEESARAVLARSYLNLGVMQAQEGRFPRAAEHFEHAAEAAPDFPQVQYSLGVAYFNAKQYDKAAPALQRAIAAEPAAADAGRMLAMSWLNTGAYDKAAALLEADPGREADPSLDYAYALALVKSNRAADAERVFSRLLALHGNTPELNVVIGQAHAQQGDFDGAIASLKRALELDPRVGEANATLGIIYLKQGHLAEAETALRTELQTRPGDAAARQTLATVLDLETRPDEAVAELRTVLAAKPEFADARYLLGKILLAQGKAQEAVEHLDAGTRLAPEDANIHYQLALAYQKLGRAELAEKELQVYRQIKEKRRAP